jgi:hypothetical protein
LNIIPDHFLLIGVPHSALRPPCDDGWQWRQVGESRPSQHRQRKRRGRGDKQSESAFGPGTDSTLAVGSCIKKTNGKTRRASGMLGAVDLAVNLRTVLERDWPQSHCVNGRAWRCQRKLLEGRWPSVNKHNTEWWCLVVAPFVAAIKGAATRSCGRTLQIGFIGP